VGYSLFFLEVEARWNADIFWTLMDSFLNEKQKIYESIYSLSQNLSESYKTLLKLQNLVNTLQNITEKTIEIEHGNNIY